MNITSIKSLNPDDDHSPDSIVRVTGGVWQYSFGGAQQRYKPLTLYFVWNSALDWQRSIALGETRSLLEIMTAAFHPTSPEDEILPSISGFRPPYLGWNGDRFLFYGPKTHKGIEIAERINHYKEVKRQPAVAVRA